MADHHGCEVGVATRGNDSDAVAKCPKHETGDPLLEAEADGGGQRSVDDRQPARRSAEQDRRSEAPVDGNLEPFEMLGAGGGAWADHAISAPPPKLKKLRKKLEAAKAIDRPKTI